MLHSTLFLLLRFSDFFFSLLFFTFAVPLPIPTHSSLYVCVTLLYEALRLLLAPNTPCFAISRLNCRCVINEYKAGKSLLISISYSAGGSAEAATVTARRRHCLGTKTPGIIKALHLSEYLSHLKSNRSFPQLALSFISS